MYRIFYSFIVDVILNTHTRAPKKNTSYVYVSDAKIMVRLGHPMPPFPLHFSNFFV